MEILQLRKLYPKRDALLLAGALPCAALLHGWGESIAIVVALLSAYRLLSAWHWNRRLRLVHSAIQERLPQVMILRWGKAFGMREWQQEGVIHHPLEGCSFSGKTVFVNVITDALSGRVVRVQTREPFELFFFEI